MILGRGSGRGRATVAQAALASLLVAALSSTSLAASPKTRRLSVSSSEVEGNGGSCCPAISADGLLVAFPSDSSNLVGEDTNGASDVFLRDRETGTTSRLSVSSSGAEGDGDSFDQAISADGRFLAFASDASNLVGDDTNGAADVFVRGPLA